MTWDESQVSVGGLLALDQVLRKPWLGLDQPLDINARIEDEVTWRS
jgi:hypothetical protein